MLYNVSEKLQSAPDIKQIAALVCEDAKRFLRSDSVSVLMLNEETGSLERVAWSGRHLHARSSMGLGDHLVSEIIRSGVGEIITDVAADPSPVHGNRPLCS